MNLGFRFYRGATLAACLLASFLAQRASGETNIPPTVRIGAPVSGSVYQAPANIAIFAQPNDVDGTVETVELFEGTNSLGVVTNGPAVMSPINPWHVFWTNVPVGAYALRAKATDDKGAIGWSEGVRVYVVESTNRPTDPDAEEIPLVPPGMGMAQRDNPAVFTISRSGPTNDPLTVYFHLSGTASNGVDYAKVGDSATIGAGTFTADVVIDPIDDFLVEGTETVVLTLEPVACVAIFPPPPGCYELGALRSAVAYIRDNDATSNLPPIVTITATDAFAAEGTNCWGATTDPVLRSNSVPCGTNTATFVVRRSGPTNSDLTVVYAIGGSASNGVDYVALPGFVTIPARERGARIVITPIDDSEVEGPETVVLSLQIPACRLVR